jgi:ankyrin repeat protein
MDTLMREAAALERGRALPSQQRRALDHACSEGHERVARELLDAGASTEDAEDDEQWSPIQWACVNDHAATVALLLERGASLQSIDVEGQTLLLLACDRGHEDVVEVLIRAGADVDESGGSGDVTPLLVAVRRGYHRIVRRLVDAGADAEALDHQTRAQPLEYAVWEGHAACFRELLNSSRATTS